MNLESFSTSKENLTVIFADHVCSFYFTLFVATAATGTDVSIWAAMHSITTANRVWSWTTSPLSWRKSTACVTIWARIDATRANNRSFCYHFLFQEIWQLRMLCRVQQDPFNRRLRPSPPRFQPTARASWKRHHQQSNQDHHITLHLEWRRKETFRLLSKCTTSSSTALGS